MTTQALTSVFAVDALNPVTLLAPNQNRDRFVVFNPQGVLYVKLAKYASQTNFTYRLSANCTLEHEGHIGYVSAIKLAGPSDVVVTELI